jgi:hypothetical protein
VAKCPIMITGHVQQYESSGPNKCEAYNVGYHAITMYIHVDHFVVSRDICRKVQPHGYL